MTSLQTWRAAACVSAAIAIYLAASSGDPNSRAVYGNTGLPANCRAYVDQTIAMVRRREIPVDDAMNGLERNCGAGGHLWRSRP